jgi:hypothetical protein
MPDAQLDDATQKILRANGETPVLGIVATGLGLASVMMPFFASVFFTPATLICGVIALMRRQKGWGTAGLLLGVLGFAQIIYTSQQIASIFSGEPGRVSLPEPAFGPPAVVTQEKYAQILEGMTYQEVRDVIGTDGEELSHSDIAGFTTVAYSWRNPNGSNMMIMFQNGRLVSKTQFGLR